MNIFNKFQNKLKMITNLFLGFARSLTHACQWMSWKQNVDPAEVRSKRPADHSDFSLSTCCEHYLWKDNWKNLLESCWKKQNYWFTPIPQFIFILVGWLCPRPVQTNHSDIRLVENWHSSCLNEGHLRYIVLWLGCGLGGRPSNPTIGGSVVWSPVLAAWW